jgi:hypothetical protein
MKYVVINTKVGYIVQNSKTHQVIGLYSEEEAKRICHNLNDVKPDKPIKVYQIGE